MTQSEAQKTLYVLLCIRNVIDRVTVYGNVDAYGGLYHLYHEAFEEAIRCVKIVNGLQDQA